MDGEVVVPGGGWRNQPPPSLCSVLYLLSWECPMDYEKPKIKSLQEIGETLKMQAKEKKRQEVRARFDTVLKDKFDLVSAGNFTGTAAPIESISIIPFIPEPPDKVSGQKPEPKLVYATVFYRGDKGQQRHTTWSIGEDGRMSGQVPQELGLAREAIAKEILRTIERVNLDFWHKTDLGVIPGQDVAVLPERRRELKEAPPEQGEQPRVDLARLEFIERQPQVLFGFVNSKDGFNGYRGAFFPRCIVLENPQVGNAAYFVDLPDWLVSPEQADEVFKLPVSQRVSADERERLIAQHWAPITERANTKGGLLAIGATRVVHTPDQWQEKMQTEIDARSKPYGP